MAKLSDILKNKYNEAYSPNISGDKTTFEQFFTNIYRAFGVKPRYDFKEIKMGTSSNKKVMEKILNDGGTIVIKIEKKIVDSQKEVDKILSSPKKNVKVALSSTRPMITIIKPELKEK